MASTDIKRRQTATVHVGPAAMGGSAPILVQSMTKVPTTDVPRCVRQIKRLVRAGCDLVRIAVPRKADTEAFAQIVQKVDVPLIADVHFRPARAIEAIEAGAAKIRLNPGNIKDKNGISRIIDAARMHGTAIRIGVNEASIKDPQNMQIADDRRVGLMLREMKRYVRLFDRRGFTDIVLSAKSSDTWRTIEVNRRIAETFAYPMHLGLTHAGLPQDALVRSAVALGTLLAEGIGDTIRVSVAGDPAAEVEIGIEILTALGLREHRRPELIVCPTCGRAEVDVISLARKVRRALGPMESRLRIAVMGCVVNGPGEAADADVALCAGKDKAFIYKHGRKMRSVPAQDAVSALLEVLRTL